MKCKLSVLVSLWTSVMTEERFGSVVFRQNFDSGNFGSVEKIENGNQEDLLEFKVWTRPDCSGTCYENGNRTWFHLRFVSMTDEHNY